MFNYIEFQIVFFIFKTFTAFVIYINVVMRKTFVDNLLKHIFKKRDTKNIYKYRCFVNNQFKFIIQFSNRFVKNFNNVFNVRFV